MLAYNVQVGFILGYEHIVCQIKCTEYALHSVSHEHCRYHETGKKNLFENAVVHNTSEAGLYHFDRSDYSSVPSSSFALKTAQIEIAAALIALLQLPVAGYIKAMNWGKFDNLGEVFATMMPATIVY